MENENKKPYLVPVAIIIAGVIVGYGLYSKPVDVADVKHPMSNKSDEQALVNWEELGPKMLSVGVISEELYNTTELNRLWALGLGNRNPVLDKMRAQYGDETANFASTGGWQTATENAMSHYSRHPFIMLTDDQQKLLEKVAGNVYRPCCGNSTMLPDCNHGMAMLGLLEYYAARGASESELYAKALEANSRWFPGQYQNILKLTQDPKTALSYQYSSASGYQDNVLPRVQNIQPSSGGTSCGA